MEISKNEKKKAIFFRVPDHTHRQYQIVAHAKGFGNLSSWVIQSLDDVLVRNANILNSGPYTLKEIVSEVREVE